MDKKSKIFFLVLGLLILGSVAVSYYRYMVKRDYIIQAQSDCNPYTEKCFVHECDPDPDVDGECTGDPVEDTWYTKNVSRIAYNIPHCDPSDENCMALVCGENEQSCSYEFCDEMNVPEGDTCNDPVVYTLENPIEEDATMEEEGIEAESDEEGITDETEGTATDSVESGTSEEEMPPQAVTNTGNAGVSTIGANQARQ
ncbi:MAG: hypothetical protein Q7S04_00745 [Candidatus Moranbacteria bacterium]|nr:hypothetical protein [Candidatus Moranbacteria bacterium]